MRDRDVRRVVRRWLEDQHAGDGETRIVDEMGVWSGSVRIDIAVINGELCGFELKSARDTLERLERQSSLYGQVFDRVTLVVAERHLDRAAAQVPEWWGLAVVTETGDAPLAYGEIREAHRNPEVDALQVARLLWRPEALALLERSGLDRGVRSKPADVLAQRLASQLPLAELCEEVRKVLKSRPNWLGQPVCDERKMPIHTY